MSTFLRVLRHSRLVAEVRRYLFVLYGVVALKWPRAQFSRITTELSNKFYTLTSFTYQLEVYYLTSSESVLKPEYSGFQHNLTDPPYQ